MLEAVMVGLQQRRGAARGEVASTLVLGAQQVVDLPSAAALGDRQLGYPSRPWRLGQGVERGAVAHSVLEVIEARSQIAPFAGERRAQIEEEARRYDAHPGELIADLARACMCRDYQSHAAVRGAVKRLEQLDQEPDQGTREHQREQRGSADPPGMLLLRSVRSTANWL